MKHFKLIALIIIYVMMNFRIQAEDCIPGKEETKEACYKIAEEFFNKKDFENAKKYYEIACNLNHNISCGNLGIIYQP
jgi:TPR repeat protein